MGIFFIPDFNSTPAPFPLEPKLPEPTEGTEPPCRNCEGTGEIMTIDWVPYGDGNVPLEQVFPCDCLTACEFCEETYPAAELLWGSCNSCHQAAYDRYVDEMGEDGLEFK